MKHHVDTHVGRKVRQHRWLVGMSQKELADRVGVSYQQLHKYETGENRISVSRLWEIARVLEVPTAHFLEELDSQLPTSNETRASILTDKEATELVRAYYGMPEGQRRRLLDLARVLGEAG